MLDLATGSRLCALAARLAGAAEVTVVNVLLAGDVCYDLAMSDRVRPRLLAARRAGVWVLVGDPTRHYLPTALLAELASYECRRPARSRAWRRKAVRVYAR